MAEKLGFKFETSQEIHLLVMNSCENPIIYRNVQENGLLERRILSNNSGSIDIFLANFVGDFNFDRINEILLGLWDGSFDYNIEALYVVVPYWGARDQVSINFILIWIYFYYLF